MFAMSALYLSVSSFISSSPLSVVPRFQQSTVTPAMSALPCQTVSYFRYFFAVVLPGSEFLPLASLAGMFYVFPLIIPFTKGNVLKTFVIGLLILTAGLYMVTNLAPAFTLAAKDVYTATGDVAVNIPAGFQGGSLDFASSPLAWIIYQCTQNLKWLGAGILVVLTSGMMWWNRVHIIRNQKAMAADNSDKIQETE